jgi:4,5-dihydroxyphthalate decarboxylase
MNDLNLKLGCWDYDRTRPILNGIVKPGGINIEPSVQSPGETFNRMLNALEFDVSEMSFTSYTMLRARGEAPFVGIPAFISREFRHSCIYVHTASGIERPEDLRGKRIGIERWNQSATVWARAALSQDYGVRPNEVQWFFGHQDTAAQKIGYRNPIPFNMPESAQHVPEGTTISAMIETGELDGLITARLPVLFAEGSPLIRRLFSDPRAVEQDYYRRTRIFPIMHTVVIKQEVYRENPWVAASLYQAFLEAKSMAEERLYETDALSVMLPWLIDEIDQTRELMGQDYWPYGVEYNLPTLEAWGLILKEQGLTDYVLKPEEMFVDTSP